MSVTAYEEILEIKHSKEQMDKFESFLKRSNIITLNVTLAVAKKTQEIRSKGMATGRKIRTPDAQHIATAILCKATVLHSLDAGMLSLSETDIVDGLKIEKPMRHDRQMSLFDLLDKT